MTLNDIYAAQIEAHFYFYIWSGVFFTILYLIVWYGFKRIAEAISQQKIVVREAVYESGPWISSRLG